MTSITERFEKVIESRDQNSSDRTWMTLETVDNIKKDSKLNKLAECGIYLKRYRKRNMRGD